MRTQAHTPRAAGRPRLLVLGLDGLSLAMAEQLARRPGFHAMRRLVANASAMDAELPELSPVNWTSFATAAGPGVHGVYGFTRVDAARYTLRLSDAREVLVPTIFERLGETGRTCKVVNLPHAWPVKPLPGPGSVLVAGFVAPDIRTAVYPPALMERLVREEFPLEADTTRGADDPDHLVEGLRRTLAARLALLDRLWAPPGQAATPDWDCFTLVLTETDRLFHFFHPAVEEESHPAHGLCLAFLQEWDAAIARVLARFDELPGPKRLLVMADHGFASLKVECDVNVWLREHGYLSLAERPPAHELDATVILPASRAFALDPGRIYLHRADRFAQGGVSPGEAAALAGEIAAGLERLTWEGEPVMERVVPGRELYQGPAADRAPDLVCVPRPGMDLKAKFDRAERFGRHGRHGAHTAHGALFVMEEEPEDERFLTPPPRRVRDVGRLVLAYFGLEAPAEGSHGAAAGGALIV